MRIRTFLTAVAVIAVVAVAARAQPAGSEQSTPNVVGAPPAKEPAEIVALIDDAASTLSGKEKDPGAVLADLRYLAAHEYPRFRALIKASAPSGTITIAGPDEPGTRLLARGRVLDEQGRPVAGVLLYAYHTDAKGWYSHRGPHVGGNAGDMKHARLFGYVRTDGEGRFELRTIRPAGYPRSDLPQHIHMHFEAEGFRPLVTEILFDDDPRLSRAQRELPGGYPICKIQRQPDGADLVSAAFTLNKP